MARCCPFVGYVGVSVAVCGLRRRAGVGLWVTSVCRLQFVGCVGVPMSVCGFSWRATAGSDMFLAGRRLSAFPCHVSI